MNYKSEVLRLKLDSWQICENRLAP